MEFNGDVTPGTVRARALAWLAGHPRSSATEVTRAITGSGRSGRVQLMQQMMYAGLVTRDYEQRPGGAGRTQVWTVAPPGTVGPPRPPVTPEQRERNSAARARARAKARAQTAPLVLVPLPAGVAPCTAQDPDLFFPVYLTRHAVAQARAVCAGCELRAPCLAGAVERAEPWGIWGGQVFEHGRPVASLRLARAS